MCRQNWTDFSGAFFIVLAMFDTLIPLSVYTGEVLLQVGWKFSCLIKSVMFEFICMKLIIHIFRLFRQI